MSRNVFDLAQAERKRRAQLGKTRAADRIAAWDKKLSVDMANAKLSASDWVSVQEAARRLGLSVQGMHFLLRTGLMQSRKVAGRRLIAAASVEREWNRRNARNSKDGFQTAKPNVQTENPLAENVFGNEFKIRRGLKVVGLTWVDYDNDDVWAPACRARELIGLGISSLNQMALKGKIRRRWAHRTTLKEIENPIGPGGKRVHSSWAVAMFSMKELSRIAAARESKEWARCTSPNDPLRSVRTSYVRTKLEAPPGDGLITRAQAAAILKVHPPRISVLVKQGTLFGWQSQPGKSGCPLYLSWNQVTRYAQNEERIAWRAAWERSKVKRANEAGQRRLNDFQERNHIWDAPGKALERNYRENYSTSQAASVLNVTRKRVLAMRRRGRLKGYRSPTAGLRFSRNCYWFFKKDDVDALKIDSRHVRCRKAYWKARMPWAYDETETPPHLGTQYSVLGTENWHPHEFDHSPSPAAKMKMEMENW